MSQQDETRKLITTHQRRLQILKEKNAIFGINTPPEILIEIGDIEAEIAKLQAELQEPENNPTPKSPINPSVWVEDTNPKLRVQIYVQGNFSALTTERRSSTIDALAGLLKIPSTAIELFQVYEGSIVFDLGIPIDAIQRLRSLLQANHIQLHQLNIEKVILEESDQIEEWVIKNGKFTLKASAAPSPPNGSNEKFERAEMQTHPQSPVSYALVMKGGGIKGLAYVGALEELEEHYTFNWFVGTSAGAIAAVLLAAGYSVGELKDILYQKDFRDFLDAKWYKWPWNFITKGGIYPAYAFTKWVDDLLADKLESRTRVKLKDLKYRVTIYASRRDEDALIFDSDDPKTQETPAAHAVRCSMSIPFIFTPQMRDGMRVLDGGMRHNYPIDILLGGQPNQNFVGLYLGPETYEGRAKPASLIEDLLSIWTEARDDNALRKYGDKTVVIDPRPIGTVDFGLDDEEKNLLLDAGRVAARKFLGLTSREEIDSEYKIIKQLRNEITEKRKTRRQKQITIGSVLALAVGLILTSLIVVVPNINGDNDATSSPTPTQTEASAVTSPPTSTPGLTSSPISVLTDTPTPFPISTLTPTISPSEKPTIITDSSAIPPGNLAIPVILNFGAKVYLTGFDGAGINGPNPISLDAQQPMFSRDGKSLMVKASIEGTTGLFKLTASGFNPEIVIKRGSGEWPVLSPDGETFMFSESTLQYRLHVRKPDGTIEEVFLKNDLPIFAQNLLWTEDNRLVFQSCATWLDQPDNCGIWVVAVNNMDPKLVVPGTDIQPMSIQGKVLAYMSRETGQDWEIYVMPMDGGQAVNVTNNDFEDGLPAISPDGNMIAYISKESGKWGLWTMSLTGQSKKHWFDIDPGRGTIDVDQWSTERMSWRR